MRKSNLFILFLYLVGVFHLAAQEECSYQGLFYCGRDHGLALEVSLKRENGEKLKSYVSLGLDGKKLYAEKPYGRVYLDNSELDLVPTIGR